MNYLKKNWSNLLIIGGLGAFLLFPNLRDFVQAQLLMKPSLKNMDSVTMMPKELWDTRLKGINVPDAKLSDFKGKTLFLNFWGTWCSPCRAEFPSIQKLYDSTNQDLAMVLISVNDTPEKIKEFLKEKNYTTPVYIADSPLPESILPKVFPTTYLLDRSGRIVLKEEASRNWAHNEILQMIAQIQK